MRVLKMLRFYIYTLLLTAIFKRMAKCVNEPLNDGELAEIVKEVVTIIVCKHTQTKEVFVSYQDRYIESQCCNCGKIIYKEL